MERTIILGPSPIIPIKMCLCDSARPYRISSSPSSHVPVFFGIDNYVFPEKMAPGRIAPIVTEDIKKMELGEEELKSEKNTDRPHYIRYDFFPQRLTLTH